ncbi:MAG: D-Ala-D-Ala carboxypeptidase family metallohydrolase [Candidatus Bathyarchaeia archaeon]
MSKEYIWNYILFSEYECSHCHRLPPLFYHDDGGRKKDVPAIYQPLFEAFEDIRTRWGKSINISSGYRCIKKQRELYDQDITTAIISVHSFGMSLDLDTLDEEETKSLVKLIEKYQPELRIGYMSYLNRGQSLVHIDTGFLISPPYSKKLYRGNRW